uniref:Putative secreted protein n=1 Tax=Ixodes ricinus TaxID=34613 RepID=A0A147BBD6_IXORI
MKRWRLTLWSHLTTNLTAPLDCAVPPAASRKDVWHSLNRTECVCKCANTSSPNNDALAPESRRAANVRPAIVRAKNGAGASGEKSSRYADGARAIMGAPAFRRAAGLVSGGRLRFPRRWEALSADQYILGRNGRDYRSGNTVRPNHEVGSVARSSAGWGAHWEHLGAQPAPPCAASCPTGGPDCAGPHAPLWSLVASQRCRGPGHDRKCLSCPFPACRHMPHTPQGGESETRSLRSTRSAALGTPTGGAEACRRARRGYRLVGGELQRQDRPGS